MQSVQRQLRMHVEKLEIKQIHYLYPHQIKKKATKGYKAQPSPLCECLSARLLGTARICHQYLVAALKCDVLLATAGLDGSLV